MAEDYLHTAHRGEQNDQLPFTSQEYDIALSAIQEHIKTMCGHTLTQVGLPEPSHPVGPATFHKALTRESAYDQDRLAESVQQREPTLRDDQRQAYKGICSKLESGTGGMVFPASMLLVVQAKPT